jgi:hypothetical protein
MNGVFDDIGFGAGRFVVVAGRGGSRALRDLGQAFELGAQRWSRDTASHDEETNSLGWMKPVDKTAVDKYKLWQLRRELSWSTACWW